MKHTWMILLGALMLSVSVFAQEPQPAPEVIPATAPIPTTSPAPTPVTVPQQRSAGPAVGTYLRPDAPSYNVRAAAGIAFDPDAFWTTLALEMQLDKFIAVGPTLQIGFSDVTDYILASVGPRFVLPVGSMEFYTGAGVGVSYRDQTGIQFTNFLVEYQIGAEYYFMKNLSVGAMARMNFLSSRAVENIPVIMGNISGHF